MSKAATHPLIGSEFVELPQLTLVRSEPIPACGDAVFDEGGHAA